ncbi:N5-glutamine methyltransferase family protein [Patescibacteria group bacterium]
MTTAKTALEWSGQQLKELDNPVLEARLILAFTLGVEAEDLLSDLDQELSEEQWQGFQMNISARKNNKPFAYITGQKDFYETLLSVSPDTLIPRPDSETIVEILRNKLPGDYQGIIQDIGTGSGALAISLGKLFPQSKIIASDISRKALAVVRQNIKQQKSRNIEVRQANLLCPDTAIQVVLANLPYIASEKYEKLDASVKDYEPEVALKSGAQGSQHYLRLLDQIAKLPATKLPQLILLECDPEQMRSLITYPPLVKLNYKSSIERSLDGQPRVIVLEKV